MKRLLHVPGVEGPGQVLLEVGDGLIAELSCAGGILHFCRSLQLDQKTGKLCLQR
ncbi:hypothetical protein D3C87_1863620 [compost metagenome]